MVQETMPSLDTLMIRVNPSDPEREAVTRAAEVLRRGGLVAFPTETVYGLGADATNPKAIERIFQAKGRPSDNPIIVHVAERKHLSFLTDDVPPLAETLIERFWPGPLTLIFSKSNRVPYAVTAGQDTVAVRMPRNKVSLMLIREFDGPVAAPSANLSGHLSGTAAEHVFQDLGGKIDLILDAGAVEVGVESTVLDISTHPPTILRPGAIAIEQLQKVLGKVALQSKGQLLRRSPGTRYRHYSPRAEVILTKEKDKRAVTELIAQYTSEGSKVGLLTRHPDLYRGENNIILKAMPTSLDEYARRMFAALRELDNEGVDYIIAEEVEGEGVGAAIMDRLRRAASK